MFESPAPRGYLLDDATGGVWNIAAPELCYAFCGFLLEQFCCLSDLLLNKHEAQANGVGTPQTGQLELPRHSEKTCRGGRAERWVNFLGTIACPLQSRSFP